jgi:hypothetical protein
VKFNFLQGDFSYGELSPRAQGHADSEAYKAGLRLAANVAPTRLGSIASRAGLASHLEGINGNTLAASNLPVQHIPIYDGPYGDFMLEVSPTGIRMVDKGGVLPWNFPPSATFLQFTQQDGSFAYADAGERAVYLNSLAASGVRSYYLTQGNPALLNAGPQNAIIGVTPYVALPTGTNETWTLSGKIAGDAVTAHIGQAAAGVPNANSQDIAVAPDASGNFSITFRPNIGGTDQDFFIQLKTGNGTFTTVLWKLELTKNGVKKVQDTTASITPPTFGGVQVAPTQERVRAVGFWTQGDFWIAFAGGAGNGYATFAMRWTSIASAGWTFGTLPTTAASRQKISGANAVAVFQDRLWYGINLANGQRVLRASAVGFGKIWNAGIGGSTGSPTGPNGIYPFVFQFVVETNTASVIVGTTSVAYTFPCDNPKSQLLVTVNYTGSNGPVPLFETADFTQAGHTRDYEAAPDGGMAVTDQTYSPGGVILFNGAVGTGFTGPGTVSVTRVALATDPLNLTLATPSGKVAWLSVLRGLLLGTTRQEKLLLGELVVDPATGTALQVQDESSYGADPALPALDIHEHVMFAQRGRKVLRLAGIGISSNGGLVSEDVGLAGEHLTKLKIRSMCYLKSPVQRVVFAFDDGTGAVMTLVNRGTGLSRITIPAFTRFTIPAAFGGIYNVASFDGDDDSELWVGTENGVTLRAKTFESDILVKQILISNANPAAPTHLVYDNDNPLPPIMDSWVRAPLVNTGGVQSAFGLPAAAVGQNAYAYVNGQIQGPYVVAAGGQVVFPASLNLTTTWVDATGARRAQEVYLGLAYPDHHFTSLPLEGGNPTGASQNLQSRKPQLHLRFVDSYLPLVNGKPLAERGSSDPTDLLAVRVTGDRRATEEGFQKGAVVDVVMTLPLRMEVSAIHGGVVMNNI